jgi:hypothetical protein
MSDILQSLKRKIMKPKSFKQAEQLANKQQRDDAKDGNAFYHLHAGNIWNPLRTYPRNNPCFCGSGQKSKRCCLPKVIPYTSQKHAVVLSEYLDQLNVNGFMPLSNYKRYIA